MKFIRMLERKLDRFGVENLMLYIVLSTAAVFVLDLMGIPAAAWFYFDRGLILSGQIWRVITFILIPQYPASGMYLFFELLSLYLIWMIGTSLEGRLGSSRFFLYYLIGTLLNIACGFIFGTCTNYYLHYSMFFAFAILYGEAEMMLFFVLPLKVKWLALLDAIYIALEIRDCFTGYYTAWGSFTLILLSLVPIVLFFPYDVKMFFRKLGLSIKRLFSKQNNNYR